MTWASPPTESDWPLVDGAACRETAPAEQVGDEGEHDAVAGMGAAPPRCPPVGGAQGLPYELVSVAAGGRDR